MTGSGFLLLIGVSKTATADQWGSIVGGGVAVIALLFGVGLWVRYWLRWRKPVAVRFFLPKRSYARQTFPGALAEEETRKSLTIGPGTYRLMVQIKAKTRVEIHMVRFVLDEHDIATRPIDFGSDQPGRWHAAYHEDWLGRAQFRDWNDEIRLMEENGHPGLMPKGDTHILTKIIETRGDWSGRVMVGLPIHGRHTRSMWHPLQLTVSREDVDEARFLRVSGPDT
jgi:hypothetical protein